MLAPIFLLTILQGAPLANHLPDTPAAAEGTVVVVDCAIADKALADCQVVGDAAPANSAAALKMASTLAIPAPVLEAGVSHVRLRLRLTPHDPAEPSQNGTNEH